MENQIILSTDPTELGDTDSLVLSFSSQICCKCAQQVSILVRDSMPITKGPKVPYNFDVWVKADVWTPFDSSYLALTEDTALSSLGHCIICSSLRSWLFNCDKMKDPTSLNIIWRVDERDEALELKWKSDNPAIKGTPDEVRCLPIDR